MKPAILDMGGPHRLVELILAGAGAREQNVLADASVKEKIILQHDAELLENVKRLNSRISPWTYIVSKWKIERFITDPEEFFEADKAK